MAGMDVHKERPQIAWAGLQEAFRTCRPTLQREAGWELALPPVMVRAHHVLDT